MNQLNYMEYYLKKVILIIDLKIKKLLKKKFDSKNKKIINIVMAIIKLTSKKFERNIKMSLQYINLSSAEENNEFIEDFDEEIAKEIKGKYCKEKLNKIIEYGKKIMKMIIGNLK